MADKRISELTAATSLADADLIPIVQGGETKRLSGSAVKAYVASTDQPSVISVNSSSDALRITQTGAGNALLVEDSANPDATPFVVDANGKAIVGHTSALATVAYSGAALIPNLQTQGVGMGVSALGVANWANNNQSPASIVLSKSKSNAVGTFGVVASGDVLGSLSFTGDDGTAFINAAYIQARVDGTPGTNDMPGRLVFATTASGASSPTDRMRITNDGRLVAGLGAGAGSSATQLTLGGTLVSAASTTRAFSNIGTAPTTSTSSVVSYSSQPSTADGIAATNIFHFFSSQGTITGGTRTAPTTQYGFNADSSLTGATNNYGFYGNIASGTGRYNFYAAGTADNYFAGNTQIQGNVGIGITSGASVGVYQYRTALSGATSYGNLSTLVAASTNTASIRGFNTSIGTAASAFTLSNIYHFQTTQGTIGAGSTVTNQYGFSADSTLTGATNNYGFYSNIASGTGRYNFYAAGTADNYFAGNVGIGGFPTGNISVVSYKPMTGGSGYNYGFANVAQINSDVTAEAVSFQSYLNTQAAAFNLSNLRHFKAFQYTLGAGSSVTNQYGYFVDPSLTGATNNYGVYSNIASGTGRWNFYAAGTADNYFAGNVGVGAVPSGSITKLLVSGNATSGTTTIGVLSNQTIQSDVTSAHRYFQANTATAASAFTVTDVSGYAVFQASIGAGSTITNQYGVNVSSSLTGATNNYGFYSNIASGTGRWNFYAAGTADSYFAGRVGIGSTSLTGYNLRLGASISGSSDPVSVMVTGEVQSTVTSSATVYQSQPSTAAAAFTLNALHHFRTYQATIGAGSTVTNQYGFNADASLTGATNNYGFYSNIASGTGRWNFYAAGTAANYLGGDLTFKPLASATPANNGDLTFEATSNTSVKIKLKGSDGVVRSVTLTLA